MNASAKSKPGPKPKSGERYSCGKLKPHGREIAPAKIRRIVEMAERGAADPLLGTPIGWLKMSGALTNAQAAAAVEYGRLRGHYDHAIDAPARTSASPSYGAAYGLSVATEMSAEDAADLAQGNVRRLYEVEKVLVTVSIAGTPTLPMTYGRPGLTRRSAVMALLDRTCVENVRPSAWELGELCTALDRLAEHFQLTSTIRK